ncbi:hypothetical protein ACFPYJ_27395 [Paenibacillus solisilvae]|uniref:Uncharacterized protein n=1 Tax=Paenibacillus solisilvae TaxID=2486751 RepID=A0ABW0W514_9BACL
MLEKIIVLSMMYILVLSTDFRTLFNSRPRAKIIYFGMMIFTLYFSIDYLVEPEFPDLDTLADAVLTKPARMIVEFLKVKST